MAPFADTLAVGPVAEPLGSIAARQLVDLGFPEGHVREALLLANGDEAVAKAVLQQWQRVPPPAFQAASPRPPEEEDGLPFLQERAGVMAEKAADIAEKAASWVQEAGDGGALLWGRLRNSWKLGGVSQLIQDASAGAGLGPQPANQDGFAEFYGYGHNEAWSPSPVKVPGASVHLPDQDFKLQDADIIEAPLEQPKSDDSNFMASGAEKSWDVLRRMSALFPMDVVAGFSNAAPSTPRVQKPRRAASAYHERNDTARQAEIAALLAQGWMTPESVRRLKQEKEELERRAAEADRARGRVATPVRPRALDRELEEVACAGSPPSGTAGTSSSSRSSRPGAAVGARGPDWGGRGTCSAQVTGSGLGTGPGVAVEAPAAAEAVARAATDGPKPLGHMALGQPQLVGSQGQGTATAQAALSSAAPAQLLTSPWATVVPEFAAVAPTGASAARQTMGTPAAPTALELPLAALPRPFSVAGGAGGEVSQAIASVGGDQPPAVAANETATAPSAIAKASPPEGATAPEHPALHAKAMPPGKAGTPPPGKAAPPATAKPPLPSKGAPPAVGKPPAPSKGAPPAGKGAAPPAKGAGKGGPPGKGAPPAKGKGPAPAVGSTSLPKGAPLGRRFEWKMLSKDKVAGTVFANLSTEVAVDVACLRALFEKPKDSVPVPKARSATRVVQQVELLARSRAQNIMIALRKQPLTVSVLQALDGLDFDADSLTPEACEVLTGAVPTPEETKQLKEYRGDSAALREAERQVMPLARMERPGVGQRLRLMLFSRMMTELAGDAKSGLASVQTALDDARSSVAFRAVLCHTVRLGTVINFGASRSDGDADAGGAVGGFNLDALSRLALFRAPGNSRITLLHVLVAQVSAADEDMPKRLLEDMSSVHKAAKRPIAPLAEDVAAFCNEAEHVAACATARTNSTSSTDEVTARLSRLSELATTEANVLKEQLSATRDAAKAALSFFALSAQPKEVDAKALELCTLLSEFLSAFERAKTEISSDPELAAACHSKAPRAREATRRRATIH